MVGENNVKNILDFFPESAGKGTEETRWEPDLKATPWWEETDKKEKKKKEKKRSVVGQLSLVTTSDSAGFPGYQTKNLIRKKGLYELKHLNSQ